MSNLILHSRAFRFSTNDEDPVNERTGFYSLNIPLAQITGNNGMGPSIDLSIIYKCYDYSYSPWGECFFDTLSKFDNHNKIIYLSTGETLHLVVDENGKLDFEKPVPINYKVEIGADKSLRVIHKNGTIEIFPDKIEAYHIRAVERIISPAGYSLFLTWDYTKSLSTQSLGSHPALMEISDEVTGSLPLLTTTIDINRNKVVQVNDLTNDIIRKFRYRNNSLLKVKFSEFDYASWDLGYEVTYVNSHYLVRRRINILNRHITPLKLVTLIKYEYPGHILPRVMYRPPLNVNAPTDLDETIKVYSFPRVKNIQIQQKETDSDSSIRDKTYIYYTYSDIKQESLSNFTGHASTFGEWAFLATAKQSVSDPILYSTADYEYIVNKNTKYYRYDPQSKTFNYVYLLSTQRRFNKFHCEVYTETRYYDLLSDKNKGQDIPTEYTSKRENYDYKIDFDKTYDEQVVYYNLPIEYTAYWVGTNQKARSETTTFEYDSNGNMINKIDPDQSSESISYYPAEGETLKNADTGIDVILCPVEPHGFVRFIKTSTLTPAPVLYPGPTKLTSYMYQSYPTRKAAQNIIDNFIVMSSEVLSEQISPPPNEVLESHIKNEFVYDIADVLSPFYSSVTSINVLEAIYSEPDNNLTWSEFKKEEFTRNLDIKNNLFSIISEETTADALTIKNSIVFDSRNLKVISKVDPLSNELHYSYENNRLSSTVYNFGTEYENIFSFDYEFGFTSEEILPFQSRISVIDSNGNINRTTCDALGDVVKVEFAKAPESDALPDFKIIREFIFTSGLIFKETTNDYDYTKNALLSSVSNYFRYTDWGQMSQTASSMGTTDEEYYDAVENTIRCKTFQNEYSDTTFISAVSGIQLKEMDKTGNVTNIQWHDSAGTFISKTGYIYDGLSRLISEQDEYLNTYLYTYDFHDRLTKIERPDKSYIIYNYQSLFDNTAKITVFEDKTDDVGVVVGSRIFDGMGRVKETTIGGRVCKYSYATPNQSMPSVMTKPDGKIIEMIYDPQLGDVLSTVSDITSTKTILQKFTYNKKFGWLDTCSDIPSSITEEFFYNSYGQPITSKIHSGVDTTGDVKITNTMEYSMLGKMTAAKVSSHDIDIMDRTWSVDSLGRPSVFSDNIQQSTLKYNALNLISEINTENTSATEHSPDIQATFTYDDFGNPQFIKYFASSIAPKLNLATIFYTYDLKWRILSADTRFLIDSSDFDYSAHELYEYDALGRLVQTDNLELKMKTVWAYDALNNLKSEVLSNRETNSVIRNCSYTYSLTDRCQLKNMTIDDTTTSMVYDANGCLVHDGFNTIEYDILDRVWTLNFDRMIYDASNVFRGDTQYNTFINYTDGEMTERISGNFVNDKIAYSFSKVYHTTTGTHYFNSNGIIISPTNSTTGPDGVATATVTSTTPGPFVIKVSATFGGEIIQKEIVAFFVSVQTPNNGSGYTKSEKTVGNIGLNNPKDHDAEAQFSLVVTLTGNYADADGKSIITITATVIDEQGNLLNGVSVSFTELKYTSVRTLTNQNATVVAYYDIDSIETSVTPILYDSWGDYLEASPAHSAYAPAFNGEVPMYVAKGAMYPLGLGYRNYQPQLKRFDKPDSESPFGAGGVNSYAYADCDPINNIDPTGHSIRKTYVKPFRMVSGSLAGITGKAALTGKANLERKSRALTRIMQGNNGKPLRMRSAKRDVSETRANNSMHFIGYHGTSEKAARNILSEGVSERVLPPRGQIGPGFYVAYNKNFLPGWASGTVTYQARQLPWYSRLNNPAVQSTILKVYSTKPLSRTHWSIMNPLDLGFIAQGGGIKKSQIKYDINMLQLVVPFDDLQYLRTMRDDGKIEKAQYWLSKEI